MDKVRVCFYLDGGKEKVYKQYNTAEINAIFLCGEVYMDSKEYKIKSPTYYVNENELGINLENI